MTVEAYQSLLAAFGQSLGMPQLAPDDEGYCALSFDDVVVHLQHEPEDDEVAAFARIGEVEEDHARTIYEMLLAANHLWMGTDGATLSIQPQDQAVFIATRMPLAALTDGGFRAWLGKFVDAAEHWTGRLAEANRGSPLDDGGGDLPGPGGSPPLGGQPIIRG